MVHDFAKIRPEPILEKRALEAPPAWSLLFTGLVTGIAVGVFGCFLIYLSGNLPPVPGQEVAPASPGQPVQTAPAATVIAAAQAQEVEQAAPDAEEGLTFDFYQELLTYEVIVDAPLVEIDEPVEESSAADAGTAPAPTQPRSGGYMLQAGAFQQSESADRQRARLEALGLQTVIKRQSVTGGSLHLVQTGPFHGRQQIADAESLLRSNNIPSMRIRLD